MHGACHISQQWERLVVWDGLPHQAPFFVIQGYDYITCSVTVAPLTMWFCQRKPKIDGHVISFAHWGCVSTMAHIGRSTRIGFLWRHASMIGPTLHEYDQPTHYIDDIFVSLTPAKGSWDPSREGSRPQCRGSRPWKGWKVSKPTDEGWWAARAGWELPTLNLLVRQVAIIIAWMKLVLAKMGKSIRDQIESKVPIWRENINYI